MMRMRFAATLIAAGLLATPMLATPVLAMDGPPGDGWHHGEIDMLHGVSLTEAQKGQIHQLMKAGEGDMRLTGKRMMDLHAQMSQALLAGATIDQLTPMLKQIEALRTEQDTQHLALVLKIRTLLTPQQLALASTQHAKLAALRAQEREIMGNHGSVPE